ncbi:response regulator transcription factor [Desulfoluna sp.]|uniref:response regulator transcription factor n=1 Tax=Desulfoluna sp. TaxID=2045199 RepID=UPI0026098AE5|nr:response regulator transcription factor [Desulfoluna sp.]
MNVLVVEDEQTDFLLIKHAIGQLGDTYRVLHAEGCREAMWAIQETPISLALVDILLPDGDGYKISDHLKAQGIPFVMVSSKSLPKHAIRCLKSGAEDYIRKPFDMDELVARLECVLRRTPAPAIDEIKGTSLQKAALPIDLTPIEHQLLNRLHLDYDTYISSDELIETVWGSTNLETSKGALRTYISHIRKKLALVQSPLSIVSKWGRGYRLTAAGKPKA